MLPYVKVFDETYLQICVFIVCLFVCLKFWISGEQFDALN